MIDLNHGSGASLEPLTLCDKINAVIDAALIERRKHEPVRTYLGASQIGEECLRKLCYGYAKVPVDSGRELTAKMIRIFDTGHAGEDAMALALGAEDVPEDAFFKSCAARWLDGAGFKIVTRQSDGSQFGWEALDGKFQGHLDGVIIGSPFPDELPPPCGWEAKALNAKAWSKVKKYGIKVASPVYFGQMQINMGYRELHTFLFTAINKNTSELHHEPVVYEPHTGQVLSDKAVTVIRSTEAGELLPRCTNNPDYYLCRLCDWPKRCWSGDV